MSPALNLAIIWIAAAIALCVLNHLFGWHDE